MVKIPKMLKEFFIISTELLLLLFYNLPHFLDKLLFQYKVCSSFWNVTISSLVFFFSYVSINEMLGHPYLRDKNWMTS